MSNLFRRVREVGLFSLPVVAGKVSEILFGIGDVIVAGRYSTIVLGALGVASAFIFPTLVFGVGVMSAISPIKARKLGAGESVERVPRSALTLAVGVGVALTVFSLLVSRFVVPLFGYEAEFERLVRLYLNICSFSITPALIFSAVRELLLARSKVMVPNALIFVFNFINVGMNVWFMFGMGLGIAGAAIATLLSRVMMAAALYAYYVRGGHRPGRICGETMREVLRVGVSAGGITVAVTAMFALVALLVGRMSVVASATNNILINITTFTFMVPFALSGVTAVKVGRAYGERSLAEIKEYTGAAVVIGVTVAMFGAAVFLCAPRQVLRIFTNQPEVVAYGAGMLLYIALYQIPDALQEIFVGALRGIGETKVPFWLTVFGIWCVGVPIGCYLCYARNMEAAGLWIGLCVGLATLGVLLGGYFFYKLRGLNLSEGVS